MNHSCFVRYLPLVVACLLFTQPLWSDVVAPAPATLTASNAFHLSPGPGDGRIAFATAKMLEQYQYSRQPFTPELSSKFLDSYLDLLDPQHVHFIQSDINQFERYRTNLDRLTLGRRNTADTTPAYEIFDRFMERLRERVQLADELLKTDTFTFDGDEKIVANRKDLPYPKDLEEARTLWRERLRYEYLQEKLAKMGAKKKAQAAAKTAESGQSGSEAVSDGEAQKQKVVKPKSETEEIVDTLTRRYNRNLKAFTEWTSDDVLQIYLTALAHVYDPHSDYFGHAQLDTFSITMNLSLFGIGAELRSEDGYCTINRLLPGGPAIKSGKIKEKDRIIAVAQSNQPPVDVVDMNLSKAVQLIRGPKGTEVKLTVVPAGTDTSESKVVTLVRDEIKLEDQEAKAKVIDLPNESGEQVRLGVIDLPSFYASFDPTNTKDRTGVKSTTADVTRLLAKLKKENVQGVVLDLRRNGGGSLEEAIRLTGLFIKKGPVVQVKNWNGVVEQDDDEDPSVAWDGPLIVLTSRFSASASEILAGALQDYGRALIVGDTSTHGKGTVQSVNPLKPLFPNWPYTNDPGALKITIKKFYRASGASTQLKGVSPDIVLPSVANALKDIGEAALEHPMEWDTIKSAEFERWNQVTPYLPELQKRSAERVAADPEFAYIREDIEQVKKLQADKMVSLNEKEKIREKEEAEARKKARAKERVARPERQEKVYELTLKLVDVPGLPPAVQKTNAALAKISGGAGAGTNVAAVVPPDLDSSDPDDRLDLDQPTAVDAVLAETERILVDYLSVLPKQSVVASGSPAQSGPVTGLSADQGK